MTDREFRVAYIDHSFHQKTKSTLFFEDLLRSRFQVDSYWDERWKGGAKFDFDAIREKKYDAFFFMQIFPEGEEIEYFGERNSVLIPMYDSCVYKKVRDWLPFYKYKFVLFSSTLGDELSREGFEVLTVRYFPPLKEREVTVEKKERYRLFFWQRTSGLSWKRIADKIEPGQFDRIHIHNVQDPGHESGRLKASDFKKNKNVVLSEWFASKEEYEAALEGCDLFFAPRLYEGIGMSFLEAMSGGKCVVAPDHPTMNEYIRHGHNGILYNIKDAEKIIFDPEEVYRCRKNARADAERMREEWLNSREKIFDFIIKMTGVSPAHEARIIREYGNLLSDYRSLAREHADAKEAREAASAELKRIKSSVFYIPFIVKSLVIRSARKLKRLMFQ